MFTSQNRFKQICGWILRGQEGMDFIARESDIMDLYFSQKQQFEIKNILIKYFYFLQTCFFRFTRS